jgi:hypothetical protein
MDQNEKKPKRKLLLNKETLDSLELDDVSGGGLTTVRLCPKPPLPPGPGIPTLYKCPPIPPAPPTPGTIGPFCPKFG